MTRTQVDMTKIEFIGKLEKELWKFTGKCRGKALELKFIKTFSAIKLMVRTKSAWHYIFISKNSILFRVSKFRFFADRRVIYYKWHKFDDHEDVIAHFSEILNQYARCIFSANKSDGIQGFYQALQSYNMQKYMEQLDD